MVLHSFDYRGHFDGIKSNLKIVASYDSIMCGTCSINRLIAWREMIEYVEGTDGVSLIFVFSPKVGDKEQMLELIENNPVDYPIYFDVENEFAKSNTLPKGLFVCLVDYNDSILFSGNPFHDDRWLLYKQIIEEQQQ